MGPDPRRKRTAKGCSVSTRIPIEMDEDKNEWESRKKMWNLMATWP